jgi:hypothetical protein
MPDHTNLSMTEVPPGHVDRIASATGAMRAMTPSSHPRSRRRALTACALCAAGACVKYTPVPAPTSDPPTSDPCPAPTAITDPCRPIELIPSRQRAIEYQNREGTRRLVPSCELDDQGVVTMTYTPLDCSPPDVWWAGCAFAGNLDLVDFDAQQGHGDGVIAIKLCVKNFVPSALNLRYGSVALSAPGHTKWMPVINGQEQFTGDGCRTVYLSPQDACYDYNRCGTSSGCYVDDSMTPPVQQCDDFSRSEISIVNEFCAPHAAATTPTVVTIERVTYFPQSCMCDDTSTCSAPRVCRRDGWPTTARCDIDGHGCPGACAP